MGRQDAGAWIERECEIDLGVRQCQRLFRRLGFRIRKPRPSIAQADPERQKTPFIQHMRSIEVGVRGDY
jgi:transposase